MKYKKPTPAREKESMRPTKFINMFYVITLSDKIFYIAKTSDSKVVFHEHIENPDFVDSHCQIMKKVMLCEL